MAKHIELTPEQEEESRKWLEEKPQAIRDMVAKIPPDRLYRIKPDGKRVCIYAYAENGTVSVIVSGKYNLVAMDRLVFGVKPEDLEECDLPGPDEKVGLLPNPLAQIVHEAVSEVIKNDPIIKHKRMVNNISPN